MAAQSPALKAFLKSMGVHAHLPLWRENYSLGALDVLRDRELALVEDMLCEKLADSPDIRAVRALAAMKSEYAVPILKACCYQWEAHGLFIAETASALWLICKDDKSLPLLLHVLSEADDAQARVVAAKAIADRPEGEALHGLFAALSDSDDDVRSAVVDALWVQLSLPTRYNGISPLAALRRGLAQAEAKSRRASRQELGRYLRDRGVGEDVTGWELG